MIAQISALDTENSLAVLPAQHLVLHGVTWQQYETLRDTLDDWAGLRMHYLGGTLEIMTPSPEHERSKCAIAMLLEAYLFEAGIRFHALGSTTFRRAAKVVGLEPDQCYCIGAEKPIPDIAIEISITSGGIDKLEIYKGLEVPEVWFWRNHKFSIYRLRGNSYEQCDRSEFLPELDLALMSQYVQPYNQFDAVVAFRQAIRKTQP
jgi:Uma2 family endonuclease